MLPVAGRTFESEKQQLQQLNSRLVQYLSRTKQLEQENARLMTEVSQLRRARTPAWEPGYKVELRELRRTVEQMALEKSQAEMEREKLWRELQMVQSLCSEQSEVCRDMGGELRGAEKQLRHAHLTNGELEKRLQQLQAEYMRLEEAHRQEMERLHRQVESRVVPIITQTYRGPPAASVEEVQDYARGLSEGWIQTFDMYRNQVEAMEQAIKADQVKLRDLQREKSVYAAELDQLRTDAQKQGQIQGRLEEQLVHMEEKFHADCTQYQMIIEQLEHQRNMMAQEIDRKMMEHQQLLQVKMDLGMEVAGYRSLLEGERAGMQEAHRRGNHQQRERIIDIKLPSQPYTPRAATTVRQHRDVTFTPRPSYLGRSSLPSGSRSPSRVIPITVTGRSQHQSPASRRDMISFNKARAAASVPVQTITKEKVTVQSSKPVSQSARSLTSEEKRVEIKQVSQERSQPVMVSEQMVSPTLKAKSQTEVKTEKPVEKVEESELESDVRDKEGAEVLLGPNEKAVLDNVSVKEIFEKMMKPAGLDAKACSSGESKVTYHVEKSEMEDGTTKTQIVLQSKVEEEVDISEDAALGELLNQGVKKMSLEDIKDAATASMIKNLLSGLQGDENLENKSVNVEIIEEPVESYSDEEEVEEQGSKLFEPSTYFQIEELDNVPHAEKSDQRLSFTEDAALGSTHEAPKEPEYLSPEPEASEYFVSTPDDNLSELEEGGGITSYGHYGLVDDLSDERYYQDERLPPSRVIVEESQEYKFVPDDRHFPKESIPECIIEEEVRVSPIVQESVLEFLREDSLEPQEQLKGALEKLQESVSGPLKEELAFLTKVSSESPQNVAIKKVQQTSGNGTMTIVAELNVSQSLEESGLLEEEEEDLSREQIMAALKSSNLDKAFQSGAGGYSFTISKEEDDEDEEFEGFGEEGESACVTTERIIKIGPSEESFTFQLEGMSSDDGQQAHILPTKISHEKKIATVYLESSTDN
ncbi:synemin [Synchiropus splendidus]|uniref:synemin n=1 Tax=Synchiropus splendidus TaxID=270530 RepID=UPI00237D518B|nr:synemin [Synchiropus splendidus]